MLHPIDITDTTPRHQQAYNLLKKLIQEGVYQPGDRLPAELELAAELGISKLTIHRAVQALAAEGWVTRTVGRGTFVAAQEPRPLQRVLLAFGASATNILGSDYYGSLYHGIAETLGPRVELVLYPDAFRAESLPKADGVLVIAPREEAGPHLQRLHATQTPTVIVGAHWPTLALPSVDSDNVDAAEQVVNHFANQGHDHLVLVYAEPETANTQGRLAGFRQGARARGFCTEELEAREFWRLSPTEKAALLVAVRSGATAVFAAGYFLALDVLNVLREAQLEVPGDVSVVGFDDPVSAQLIFPPLTTLRQQLHHMGRRAALRLAAQVAGTDDGRTELVPVELIIRSSTSSKKGLQP